ncbi:MAG: hypothetical protein MJ141_03270, partial [Clostridia bacterium]|nr:hypothetical protein [Clostridia bacterium]
TRGYAGAEQFGFTQSDQRTDIYAVGVLLNVMLTGKLPKDALAGGRLGRVVRKCTEIEAEKRYRSVADIRASISNLLDLPEVKGRYAGLDKVIRAIPGLRSDKWWVVVLSIIWYSVIIFVMGAFFIEEPAPDLKFWVLGILSELALFILPYFCFFNFLGVWDWIPFTRGASRKNQRIIYTLIGIALIAFGFYLVPIEVW